MLRRDAPRNRRRRGAVLAETAMVILVFLSFVFGIFEYCRFMMDWNLLNNAAREGCRYAIVNNTSTGVGSGVTTVVTNYMAGETASFTNFTASVTGTHNGVATAVNSLAAGDMVTVTVTGTYKFMNIIPVIKMPTTLSMGSSVTMGCEGGT